MVAIWLVPFGEYPCWRMRSVTTVESKTACPNNLRQVALSLHNYHNQTGSLPAGFSYQNGKSIAPLASWEIAILPSMEQVSVFHQAEADYKSNSNFAGKPPHKGLSTLIPAYVCPADSRMT